MTKKKAVALVRFGGVGDALLVTPVIRAYHDAGWDVDYYGSPDQTDIFYANPNIRKVHYSRLQKAYETTEFSKGLAESGNYTGVINLHGSVEGRSLYDPSHIGFYQDKHEKWLAVGKHNYLENTLEMCGVKWDNRPPAPEFYWMKEEEAMMKFFRIEHKDKFLVMWQCCGSYQHKVYPYVGEVMDMATRKMPELHFVLSGHPGQVTPLVNHPQVTNRIGAWSLRQALLHTAVMDCVVTPETWTTYAAWAANIPQVAILTHTSEYNNIKWMNNVIPVKSPAFCSPCFRMPRGNSTGCHRVDVPTCSEPMPICMTMIKPEMIVEAIKTQYNRWKKGRNPKARFLS